MTVKELRKHLDKLISQGYGDYKVIDEGYGNEVNADNITIDKKREQIEL